MAEVRRAVLGDVARLSAVLARAFRDDPVSVYIFPEPTRRVLRLEAFFRLQIGRIYLRRGEVYTTGDRTAAAMWMPPRAERPSPLDELVAFRLALSSRSYLRGRRLALLLHELRPREEHYYLGTIGTDPPFQRRGLASALIEPMLAHLDVVGLPAYLESSTEENVRFYRRFGFVIRTRGRIGTDGPPLWLMWRDPQPHG